MSTHRKETCTPAVLTIVPSNDRLHVISNFLHKIWCSTE